MKHKKVREEIKFNAADLLKSVQSVADHASGKKKITMRNRELDLPKPIKPMKPSEIRALRGKLRVSQSIFARLLNVPRQTAISWEKGVRKPSGAALKLLTIARRAPNILRA